MLFILAVLNLYLPGNLPEGFLYQENSRKIVLSPAVPETLEARKNCHDLALLHEDTGLFAVVSHCPGPSVFSSSDWSFFTLKSSWPAAEAGSAHQLSALSLAETEELFGQRLRLFWLRGQGLALLTNYGQSGQTLCFLSAARAIWAENFIAADRAVLFSRDGNWYLLGKQAESAANTESEIWQIKPFPALKSEMPETLWWNQFSALSYLPGEKLLLLKMQRLFDQSFSIYSLAEQKWLLLPESVLSQADWQMLKSRSVNVLFRLERPAGEFGERVYYEIWLDGEMFYRTGFYVDGQSVPVALNIAEGMHRLEVVRFVAEGGSYTRDKNINQCSPLVLPVDSNRVYLLYSRKAFWQEKKTFELELQEFDRP